MTHRTEEMPGSESNHKPSVAAIFLCYNSETFVAEALRSALTQDCDPMEIIISDDASEDDTFEIVQREVARYSGPHRVVVARRSINTGTKSAHLNVIFPSVASDLIVSFDDDDISERSRVNKIVAAFRADSRVQAVYSSFSQIGGSGQRSGRTSVPHPASDQNTRAWFARVDTYAAGTTLAIRREVIEKFGALDPQINEDIVLPFRASLLGEVKFIDEPLVKARRHPNSLTFNLERYESVENYRLRMQSGIEAARRNRESRLADIRTALSVMPERAEELRALERIVFESMAEVEITGQLVSPSFRSRLSALLKLIRIEALRGELAQDACLALAPALYLRYKRRQLQSRIR